MGVVVLKNDDMYYVSLLSLLYTYVHVIVYKIIIYIYYSYYYYDIIILYYMILGIGPPITYPREQKAHRYIILD